MKIIFKDNEFDVPDTIDLLDPGDLAWVSSLFDKLLELYNNPLDIWKAVYEELFTDELLTENHKYGICVLFSSMITERYLTEQFNEDLSRFAGILQQIQGEDKSAYGTARNKLILP